MFVFLFVEGTRRVRDGDIYIYRRSIKEGTWSVTRTSQAVKCCSSLTLSTIWKWEDICRIGISWGFYFEPSGDFILSQVDCGLLFGWHVENLTSFRIFHVTATTTLTSKKYYLCGAWVFPLSLAKSKSWLYSTGVKFTVTADDA